MKRRVYNAITGEWLDKTANKVNNNERKKVYNAITGEWLEDSFAQNTPKISNNTQQKSNVTKKKKQYEEEKKKQNNLKSNVVKTFSSQDVMVTSDGFGNTTRVALPIQKQSQYANNGFSVSKDSLTENVKKEQKYNEIKKSEEYKQKKQELTQQANAVGYAKYDYDREVVNEDKIGLYDKTIGRVLGGAKSVFDISGGMIQNDNGDYVYLPNKTELKNEKVQKNYNSGVGKFLGTAAYEIGKIGGTTLVNSVVPYAGSTAYFGRMFMDSTNNAMREGYSSGRAITYGLTNTTMEFLTGKLLGSATKGLTGGSSSELSNAIGNGINKLIKNPKIANILGNAGSEATEEFIQEYLDNINKLITLEGSTNIKEYASIFKNSDVLNDALYSAGVGAVTGGTLGALNNNEGKYAQYNTNLFQTFKEQLEISKNNLTDPNDMVTYNNAINMIDEYLKKPFGNESKVQKIIPTVEDIVAQENAKKAEDVVSNDMMSNDINAQGDTSVAFSDNNIAQSNNGVNFNKNRFQENNNYFPTINTNTQSIGKYNIKNLNNHNEVILKVIDFLKNSYLSTENQSKPIKNIATGMEIEIRQSGIRETFGNPKYYDKLSFEMKKAKISTMEHLAKMIKYGVVRSQEAPNYHNKNSKVTYAYLKHPINIDGKNYLVNIDIRKSPKGENRFYIHSLELKKETDLSSPQSELLMDKSISYDNNIPQINDNVKSGISTTNDMQNINIDTIKQTKGNIPINRELLNKYATVREIFDSEANNYDGNVKIKNNIKEIEKIDFNNTKIEDFKKIANEIFKKYNSTTIYNNNGNEITVNKSGINESIEKIFNNRKQRNLLKEHLQVFSDLGDIIEHAKLVNQSTEIKNRKNINNWNYYYDGLNINDKIYKLVFDVRSMDNGENQYRVQRLELNTRKTGDYDGDASSNTRILPPYSQPVSDNNIPQINNNVKLSIVSNNDMQNNDNNTNKIKLPTEKNTLGYIPQDPTRESTYDDPITQPITEFQRALDREMEYGIKSPKEIKNKNNLRHQVSETYGWLQEQFVNRNYEIDKYAKQTNNNEIMFKGDMLNSVAGEVSGEINVAQTDNYGHKIGESLSSLFKKSKQGGYYEQFDDYLKHYSNIDRHKYGKGSVVPLEYSQKMVQYYEKTIPGIKEEASKVWKYGRNILDNLEENGLITKEYKKGTLEEMYPHYVPYMQSESMVPYMDDSGEIKPKKVIKRAEGNAHDLVTIEESFARYTYAAKKAIRQNDLYKEIVKSTKEKVSFGADDRIDPTQLDNSLMRDNEGNNYLTAYVDGLQQQVKINDNLYNELLRTDEKRIKAVEEKLSLVIKPLQKVSEIRRNILTTWNLSFVLTNPSKDIQDGLFNSKYTKDFAMYLPTSIYELATQSTETARQFSSLYGSGMVMGDYQVDKLNNAVKNMDIKQVNKLLKIIPNANELVELAPRYAEFKASLKNGTSVTEAMYNAREVTTNFNRGGYITKALNRDGFTFLNASVQGFDKLIRNLTGINGTKGFIGGVTGIMTKVAVLGIAPALFNAMSFGAGDDEEDEDYKALPNYIKDNYYLFKAKGLSNKSNKYYDGTFIRIPKGRMLSIFGSAARRTLEYAKGNKNAFDGYLENVQSQIGINNPEENNIFAPIKQAFGSKNGEAWYGGDLVPKRLQNKPVAEQYDESTDEFSKWLGEMLNISPYKINYLLDQYSGGAGDIILPMITSETTNGATKVSDYLLAPIKDKFVVNSTDDNKYASNFYSLLEKTQIQANSDKATDSDKLKYKYMTSINSELSKLYKEKREIQMNDTLSKKEKYKKVQNIQKEINELSKEGTKIPKVKDLKSNYAKLNNDEYYKNQKGTWTKIKEEETNQLKELNMSANEKNEYFIAKNKIGVIRNNEDLENDVKKNQISNIIIDLNMSDDKLSYLYSKYYSSEETLEVIKSAGISIKEFIKYNSQEFTTDYYSNGKAIPNSRENKVIKYVNSLNLSIPQKALLIKMEYSSYKKYDKQIAEYVNSMNISFLDKASILKKAGFTSYDKQIINYVNKMNITKTEKEEILEEMGFTIRNGRVYSK